MINETIEEKALRLMKAAINFDDDIKLPIDELRKNPTFVHTCKVVELAIAEEREACGWQPIETAPKDGTVLVYLKDEHLQSRIHVATYHPRISIVGGYFDFDVPPATHWQPLPEAPKDEATK